MNIEVEYIDTNGTLSNRVYNISMLGFIKHLAIAGQGYAPKPQKLMRTIGMLFHYSQYLRWRDFINDKFSEPPDALSDPTEKGHFSNLVGKAIADFLSKRIDNSLFTVNYEAAMRLRRMSLRRVSRPDLLAFSQNSIFAIEAKGFTGGFGDMVDHKNQSRTGGIPVNFTVASVSYDLYNRVKCNYHDPYDQSVPYDIGAFQQLTKKYYKGLEKFLNQKAFNYREVIINKEAFYEVDLFYRNFLIRDLPYWSIWPTRAYDYYLPKLILPKAIHDYAQNGLSSGISPFVFDSSPQDNTYIDNDRVGLRLGDG